jgi:hypothetical protein
MSVTESVKANPGAGAAVGSLLILLAGFAIWALLYLSGAFPWLGYAWLARSSISAGPVGVIGESRAGTSLGVSTFLFFEGQNVVIDYDADIRAGALWFYVYRPFDGALGDGVAHYVTKTSSGVWGVRIPQTGFYSITIEPTVSRGAGHGWDMSYTAWWGARPG